LPDSSPNPPSRALRAAFVTLVLATALTTAGCGAVSHLGAGSGSAARGKVLFQKNSLPGGKPGCGSCHTLADAGTKGIIGPNLDAAFLSDKCQGFDLSTLRDVVRGQIAYATSEPGVAPTYSGKGINAGPGTGMPQNLFEGQQAKDVATYVAKVAGKGMTCPTYQGKGVHD
jgi:hypothetical protein